MLVKEDEIDKEHIENILKNRGVYVSTTAGVSMFPMLRNRRDTIIVKPVKGSLHKYDIPLYKRGNDYVLHRIVKIKQHGYVICGDNCLNKEYNVTDKDIIGVLSGFYRDNHMVNMDGMGYKLYCRLWVALYPVRFVVKICCIRLKRIIKNVFF